MSHKVMYNQGGILHTLTPHLKRIPGILATLFVTLVTSLWTYWSMIEMYYEGWQAPWYIPFIYLIPMTICLILSFCALKWNRFGGWFLIIVGTLFTIWWWGPAAIAGKLTMERVMSQFPVSGMLVVIGGIFLLAARYQRERIADGWQPSSKWYIRHIRFLFGLGIPFLIIVGSTIYWVPILATRVDDGDYSARIIEGDGITLMWAPKGPGWLWKQSWGGYPSWNSIAWYGLPPVGIDKSREFKQNQSPATMEDMETTGLCHYLAEDGVTLMDEPQDIWRMPTTEEIVGSLMLHNENAGCQWNGTVGVDRKGPSDCDMQPDKETPLWSPSESPIYYWSGDEYDAEDAYYVNYQGYVNRQPKKWGNPRHTHRCVREVPE